MIQSTMTTSNSFAAKACVDADFSTALIESTTLQDARILLFFQCKQNDVLIYKSDDLKRDHLSQFSYPRSTGTTQLAQGIIESVNDSTVFFSSSYSHDEDDAPRLVYCCDDAIGITSPLPIVW